MMTIISVIPKGEGFAFWWLVGIVGYTGDDTSVQNVALPAIIALALAMIRGHCGDSSGFWVHLFFYTLCNRGTKHSMHSGSYQAYVSKTEIKNFVSNFYLFNKYLLSIKHMEGIVLAT